MNQDEYSDHSNTRVTQDVLPVTKFEQSLWSFLKLNINVHKLWSKYVTCKINEGKHSIIKLLLL